MFCSRSLKTKIFSFINNGWNQRLNLPELSPNYWRVYASQISSVPLHLNLQVTYQKSDMRSHLIPFKSYLSFVSSFPAKAVSFRLKNRTLIKPFPLPLPLPGFESLAALAVPPLPLPPPHPFRFTD